MLKHVVFLLFLYGVKNVSSNSSASQEPAVESKDVSKNGIKKNEVGANGLEANWERVTRNFRNPVLEYLLQKNADRTIGPPQRGVVREIRHSQTLLLPGPLRGPLPEFLVNQLPQFQSQKKPEEQGTRNPDDLPFDNFWNFLKNKTQPGGSKLREKVISSPVLHLNKNPDEIKRETTRLQVYPAVAFVINTFDKDGSLKSSVTHFQPDFNSLTPQTNEKEAHAAEEKNKNYENMYNSHHTVDNIVRGTPGNGHRQETAPHQGISWPFAGYFPIVINDPFLSFYNAFATSMYNAVSTMVEYGPEADICLKGHGRTVESEIPESEKVNLEVTPHREAGPSKMTVFDRYQTETKDTNIFDEVTMESENFKRISRKPLARKRRDATSILVKSREGDTVNITLEEPTGSNGNKTKSEGGDLILRKGGIAIAGPGGAATAYTGGTAIVGPYGTVYKSPEGTAILGPFSKVVNITDDTSFEEILKMHKEMQSQALSRVSTSGSQQGGIGFKNFRNYFSYKTNLPIKFEVKPQGRSFIKSKPRIMRLKEEGIVKAIEEIKQAEFRRIVQDAPVEWRVAKDNDTTLIFRPKSKAEAGRSGVALSAPTSHAILYPGQKTNIYFEPESVASAGPAGFAHAHSDLFVTFVKNNETLVLPERRERSLKAILLKKPNIMG